jgi:hypothetical protein
MRIALELRARESGAVEQEAWLSLSCTQTIAVVQQACSTPRLAR